MEQHVWSFEWKLSITNWVHGENRNLFGSEYNIYTQKLTEEDGLDQDGKQNY